MKFQVYFNPDFDYFDSTAKWISLAAFRAVRSQAEVTSQQRVGSQKYRVFGPEGGGFAQWTSPATSKKIKGTSTVGKFEITPNPVYADNEVTLSVQLNDVGVQRRIYFLTAPTCDGTVPWIAGRGPGTGWSVLGQVTRNRSGYGVEQLTLPYMTKLSESEFLDWVESKVFPIAAQSSTNPVSGLTSNGQLSFAMLATLFDSGRCLAAIAPAVGTREMWVSSPLKLQVLPPEKTTFSLTQTSFEVAHGATIQVSGKVSGGKRSITFYRDSTRLGETTSDADGSFSQALSMVGNSYSAGSYQVSLLADATATDEAGSTAIDIKVNRATVGGSVSVSATSINVGQQFTLSGTLTPAVAGRDVWFRAYCSTHSNYPTGWAAQTSVWSVNQYSGAPTGNTGLENYNWQSGSYDYAVARTNSSGAFSMTFTTTSSRTCVYGAYAPQSDYYTAWLSDPTPALVVQ